MKKLLFLLLFPVISFAADPIFITAKILPGHDINLARVELANKGWRIVGPVHSDGTIGVVNKSFTLIDNGVVKTIESYVDGIDSQAKFNALKSTLDTELSLSHVDFFDLSIWSGNESNIQQALVDGSTTIYVPVSNTLPGHVVVQNDRIGMSYDSEMAHLVDAKNVFDLHATAMAISMRVVYDQTDFFNLNDQNIHHFSIDENGDYKTRYDTTVKEIVSHGQHYYDSISIPMSFGFEGMEVATQGRETFEKVARDTDTPTFKSSGNPYFDKIGNDFWFRSFETEGRAMHQSSNDIEVVNEVRNVDPNYARDQNCNVGEVHLTGKQPNGQACASRQVCPLDINGIPTVRFAIDTDIPFPVNGVVAPVLNTIINRGTSVAASVAGDYASDIKEHIMGNGYPQPSKDDIYAAMEASTKEKSGRQFRDACTGWGVYDHGYTKAWVARNYPSPQWGAMTPITFFGIINTVAHPTQVDTFKEACQIVVGGAVITGSAIQSYGYSSDHAGCANHTGNRENGEVLRIVNIYKEISSNRYSAYPNGKPVRP